MFVCQKCDAQFPKWVGRCDVCDAWGTVTEEVSQVARVSEVGKVRPAEVQKLSDTDASQTLRVETKIMELDRVLGGGVVPGSLLLLSGEPGIGKSTLAAMIGNVLGAKSPTLYVSGEESAPQLAGRLERLGCDRSRFGFISQTVVESVIKTIEGERPALAIVDSVQTLSSSLLDTTPGSASLIRYATNLLLETAKRTHIPILIVGQVTKDGSVAGPKTLEHLVDVVLSMEGDADHATRVLRSTKNRFGSTDEVGVFEMREEGLVEVTEPGKYFLGEDETAGRVVTATLQGSRVFFVEVQALVETSVYPNPIRRAQGFSERRLQMLAAILSKRAGIKLADKDLYINVVGGLKLTEPAADLAVSAAIASAAELMTIKPKSVFFGEVGLRGEVRTVRAGEKRAREAKRIGFEHVVSGTQTKSVQGLLS